MDIPAGREAVFAFDFDGVICDSARENGLTTWRALRTHWPTRVPETPPEGLLGAFLTCRPAIETGYQNIPLMWMLLDGIAPERILTEFDALTEAVMRALHHFRNRRHEVILFHVFDKTEIEFPFQETMRFVDMETGERLQIDPSYVREDYKRRIEEFIDFYRRSCADCQIDYVNTHTSVPYDLMLSRYLHKRSNV